VSHYCDINIGKWNKPYFLQVSKPKKTKAANKTSKTVLDTSIKASAEAVACMTKEQREEFVDYIVTRFPNLADDLMSTIGYGLMDKEEKIH